MKRRDEPGPARERSEGDVNETPLRRAWTGEHLSAEARGWLEEDARHFLHQSLSTPCLNVLASCRGSGFTDLQGRAFLDFHGNAVHQVGYGHPAVLDAVIAQLRTLPFCPRRYTNRPAVELARELTRRAPGALNKVLFAPGGTEAVGMALKLARAVTGRFKTVSWWDSFHGASLDAISVGGEALFRAGMGPLLPGAVHVPPPSTYRRPFGSGEPDPMESAAHLEYVMEHEGDVGAVVAEPVRSTGVIVPPAAYWERVRRACDRHGALLIFDEIPLCLGRTGRLFACERFGVTPDILCLGKGLGGGVFPMAAVIAREDLDAAPDKALGHYTHEKSPVGSAAALATLRVLDEEGLVERSRRLGERALARLRDLQGKHPLIGDVRGAGLLLGVELVQDRSSREPAPDAAERVLYGCLRRGLSFKVSVGNVLTLMPPLTIAEGDLDRALDILDASLSDAAG